MKLRVLLPTEILIDVEVEKIVAEAENGSFCLLPRHTDFVTALVPGILSFTTNEGREQFLAVGDGVLVKSGSDVRISTRHAAGGGDLGTLRQTVVEKFQMLDDKERVVRSVIAKLEADFVRRFLELGEPRHV